MTESKVLRVHCQVTGEELAWDEVIPADLVRPPLIPFLRPKSGVWDPKGYVSLVRVNEARSELVKSLILEDSASLRTLNEEVARSLESHNALSRPVEKDYDESSTFGQRLADKIASFGGSWTFILIFLGILVCWIVLNSALLRGAAFDPYPFILLNLVLSCIAALQAPVIMMSQNRQEQKDRLRGENDYKVNLKAELEIRHLTEKMDQLLNDQWKHLLEIQQIQTEMIQEMRKSVLEGKSAP